MKKKNLIVTFLLAIGIISITVGVTMAFFNYTRIGLANTISTGRIYFNSGQDGRINLTNIFPIDPEETGIMDDNTKVGTVAITVTGDTSYDNGVEYLVSAVNVNNTVGTKTIPISISTTASGTLGTSDDNYFEDRDTATSHIYKVLAKDTISNNDQLMVGYIAKNTTGINGTITIKAYIDKNNIAITDTPEENTNWQNGREVFTTTEWNSMQGTGVSFQIKVEANEGVWVEEPIPTISSCPGCKFSFPLYNVYYYNGANQSTMTNFVENDELLVDDYRALNKNIFLGFKFENNIVVKAYACGIKGTDKIWNSATSSYDEFDPGNNQGTAFCMEASMDGSTFTLNKNLILGQTLWNDLNLTGKCYDHVSIVGCNGSVSAMIESGDVHVEDISAACTVNDFNGMASCTLD